MRKLVGGRFCSLGGWFWWYKTGASVLCSLYVRELGGGLSVVQAEFLKNILNFCHNFSENSWILKLQKLKIWNLKTWNFENFKLEKRENLKHENLISTGVGGVSFELKGNFQNFHVFKFSSFTFSSFKFQVFTFQVFKFSRFHVFKC